MFSGQTQLSYRIALPRILQFLRAYVLLLLVLECDQCSVYHIVLLSIENDALLARKIQKISKRQPHERESITEHFSVCIKLEKVASLKQTNIYV